MITHRTPSPASEQGQYRHRFHLHDVTNEGISKSPSEVTCSLPTGSGPAVVEVAYDTGTLRLGLAAVTFLDSTGLGAQVGIRDAASEARRVLLMDRPSPHRLLEAMDPVGVVTIEPGTSP